MRPARFASIGERRKTAAHPGGRFDVRLKGVRLAGLFLGSRALRGRILLQFAAGQIGCRRANRRRAQQPAAPRGIATAGAGQGGDFLARRRRGRCGPRAAVGRAGAGLAAAGAGRAVLVATAEAGAEPANAFASVGAVEIAATLQTDKIEAAFARFTADEPVAAVELRAAALGSCDLSRPAGFAERDTGQLTKAVVADFAIAAVDRVRSKFEAAFELIRAPAFTADRALAAIFIAPTLDAEALDADAVLAVLVAAAFGRADPATANSDVFQIIVVADVAVPILAAFGAGAAPLLLVEATLEAVAAGAVQTSRGCGLGAKVTQNAAATLFLVVAPVVAAADFVFFAVGPADAFLTEFTRTAIFVDAALFGAAPLAAELLLQTGELAKAVVAALADAAVSAVAALDADAALVVTGSDPLALEPTDRGLGILVEAGQAKAAVADLAVFGIAIQIATALGSANTAALAVVTTQGRVTLADALAAFTELTRAAIPIVTTRFVGNAVIAATALVFLAALFVADLFGGTNSRADRIDRRFILSGCLSQTPC
jgi:hypothetical protein